MFSDATLAEAILDRITHRSHQIVLKGESVRKQAAKA
ncbi:ATP-binding protein [Pseudomonas sp. QE6]